MAALTRLHRELEWNLLISGFFGEKNSGTKGFFNWENSGIKLSMSGRSRKFIWSARKKISSASGLRNVEFQFCYGFRPDDKVLVRYVQTNKSCVVEVAVVVEDLKDLLYVEATPWVSVFQ